MPKPTPGMFRPYFENHVQEKVLETKGARYIFIVLLIKKKKHRTLSCILSLVIFNLFGFWFSFSYFLSLFTQHLNKNKAFSDYTGL